MIAREIIDDIVARNDVESVISSYVSLRALICKGFAPSTVRERRPLPCFRRPKAFTALAVTPAAA